MAGLTPRGALPFAKMSGSGNDFIIMDSRDGLLEGIDLSLLARRVCRRHTSVGADGLIVIDKSNKAHFKWHFFNSDGSAAEMCGNGGRCAARFAHAEGIAPSSMSFETQAGIISAEVRNDIVKVQLTPPFGYEETIGLEVGEKEYTVSFVNTGVPHVVALLDDVDGVDVLKVGRYIRNHERFQPAGTNVNFAAVTGPDRLRIRTYERGVEGETKACGTGSVASALVAWKKGLAGDVVQVETAGGEILTVHIRSGEGEEYPEVFLEGKTIMVCRGEIDPEAYI